jgi:dTDP-4-amino-4,6-dideoxygalactose transaminase
MEKPIPYGKQFLTEEDFKSVLEVLNSEYLTQGPKIPEFEHAFCDYINAKHGVAVNNGTAALHIALKALGIEPNQYVLVPPITFAASANCIEYNDATPLFTEVDEYGLMDLNHVEALVKKYGKKIKGAIPVQYAGKAVNLKALKDILAKVDGWILEDACHAPGGTFDDFEINFCCGDGKYSDASIFSFHPVKHIATGEGGMVTTPHLQTMQKLRTLRTHGITRDSELFQNSIEIANGESKQTDYPIWYMEMQELGYNYRLTDFQAALGISQLARANENLKKRRKIARFYMAELQDLPIQLPFDSPEASEINNHALHLFVIKTEQRRRLYDYLRNHNIFAQIHYFPIHLMPYYRNKYGLKPGDIKTAENFYSRCMSIPMFPSLSEKEMNWVVKKIKAFFHHE